MNQVASFNPPTILRIEGDPNLWGLTRSRTQDPGWDGPVALEIGAPVNGRLILSPACMGGFSLTYNDAKNGWHPADLPAGSLFLYIPTATLLTGASSGYTLAAEYDNLDALQARIMGAMSAGSTLALNQNVVGGGVVVLNGAQLPFVAIAEGA
jgi:hypothetical protein